MNFNRDAFFSRTMHTPDDPERARRREALREMSRALLPLHRALIEHARADYKLAYDVDLGPSQMVGKLSEDPFFAWLRPVTSLIVDIDEMSRKDFSAEDVEAIHKRIDRLFGAQAEKEFTTQYVPILQRDVDVAIGHAGVRQTAAKLR
jgi:hypothetical protein